jgi:hypothetical protein
VKLEQNHAEQISAAGCEFLKNFLTGWNSNRNRVFQPFLQ